MELHFKLPNLTSMAEAENVKETILTTDPQARVDFDIENRMVIVHSSDSEETIKQVVTATGHPIESIKGKSSQGESLKEEHP